MSLVNLKSLSSHEIGEFFASFDTIVTDCDGVIWVIRKPLANSAEVLNAFREKLGKRVFYVTNNCMMSRADVANKCRAYGCTAAEDDVLCASYLAASYLESASFEGKAYVIGRCGITDELDKVGIRHCGVGTDVMPTLRSEKDLLFEKDGDVGAVIVGFDEHFSYAKMVKAATYLKDESVHFIAANMDERFPTNEELVVPGSGSLVRCIEYCTGRQATVVGKPETYISSVIKNRFDVDPERTLMIGDSLRADILLGTRCGFKTLLVLSGNTKLEQVEKLKRSSAREDLDLVPDYYIDTLGDLLPYLQKLS